jgi:hypothetical protein
MRFLLLEQQPNTTSAACGTSTLLALLPWKQNEDR